MQASEFMREQFISLRTEIEQSKAREFKVIGFGLVIVPSAHFLATVYELKLAILTIPILVIVVALLFLAENHTLMRCGAFIKKHIESNIPGAVGWETWLEEAASGDRRLVDKYLTYCLYLLYLVYYTGSVSIATEFAMQAYGITVMSILLGGYVAVGVWFLIFLVKSFKLATSTSAFLE